MLLIYCLRSHFYFFSLPYIKEKKKLQDNKHIKNVNLWHHKMCLYDVHGTRIEMKSSVVRELQWSAFECVANISMEFVNKTQRVFRKFFFFWSTTAWEIRSWKVVRICTRSEAFKSLEWKSLFDAIPVNFGRTNHNHSRLSQYSHLLLAVIRLHSFRDVVFQTESARFMVYALNFATCRKEDMSTVFNVTFQCEKSERMKSHKLWSKEDERWLRREDTWASEHEAFWVTCESWTKWLMDMYLYESGSDLSFNRREERGTWTEWYGDCSWLYVKKD